MSEARVENQRRRREALARCYRYWIALIPLLIVPEISGKVPTQRIVIDSYKDETFRRIFRFHKDDIDRLISALRIPNAVRCNPNLFITGTDAFLVMCARLAKPMSGLDMTFVLREKFTESQISTIFNFMIRFLAEEWNDLLSFAACCFNRESILYYQGKITARGGAFDDVAGFIDVTFVFTVRPVYGQEALYNGWKRGHGIKFQGVTFPDGIIASFYGPVPGRRHDEHLVHKSEIKKSLRIAQLTSGIAFKIYGDPAYRTSDVFRAPFPRLSCTEEQRLINEAMSAVRIGVEWSFRDVKCVWRMLKLTDTLRVLQRPVALYCRVACLLTNCRTCLYGNIVSKHFDCIPPSLEEYLC